MISVLEISQVSTIHTKGQNTVSSRVLTSGIHNKVPAESLGHTGVFYIRVGGQAPDEDRDHLQRNMLHKAGQGD